jgi:hypothetical protein
MLLAKLFFGCGPFPMSESDGWPTTRARCVIDNTGRAVKPACAIVQAVPLHTSQDDSVLLPVSRMPTHKANCRLNKRKVN